MKGLVIGYGSIGARHARLMAERGVGVSVVSRNVDCPFPRHESVAVAVDVVRPDAVVVANDTARHAASLRELQERGFSGPVLVEKPLFGGIVPPDSDLSKLDISVAFNLRFHPLIQKLREAIAGRKLYFASFHAGQHLPDWRPAADYRAGYSAKRAGGGGVLRDLSHELDLALWLCGGWRRVAAIAGRFSALEIETEDTVALTAEMDACPAVSISLNYLDRMPRRQIAMTGEGFTAVADLVASEFVLNGEKSHLPTERDTTYRAQLDACLTGRRDTLCSYRQALEVETLIDETAAAAARQEWRVRKRV